MVLEKVSKILKWFCLYFPIFKSEKTCLLQLNTYFIISSGSSFTLHWDSPDWQIKHKLSTKLHWSVISKQLNVCWFMAALLFYFFTFFFFLVSLSDIDIDRYGYRYWYIDTTLKFHLPLSQWMSFGDILERFGNISGEII